ncbi:NirD/YgiW/YdeI family stress tolerance protein [Pseudoxanthomonas sp. UTMC 1351]|uniref:NirD/YgiW/YdeI family stress tolerance protein n=1 Tax=Pseudoxanthomonas sp. UTMC 1351 TaxID=2695853 RepID=UPI0034CF3EDF
MNFRAFLSAALLLPISTVALAQYTGPSAVRSATTAEAASKAADNTPVVLEGVLASHIGNDTYEFKDASGTVRVEIDPEDFPLGTPIEATTPVRLIGEVEKDWGKVEIDVERMEVLN